MTSKRGRIRKKVDEPEQPKSPPSPPQAPEPAPATPVPPAAPTTALPANLIAPRPAVTAAVTKLGSYGNASIDQHDALFIAASDAVQRKKGVRVNPRVTKAMMGLESIENGNYPVDKCRPFDGHPGPLSCGPMQIKWPFHEARCRECSNKTVAGHVELATHIIGDTMLAHDCDEYEAYIRGYLTSDDINGTTQQEAVAGLKRRVRQMEASAGGGKPEPKPEPRPDVDPMRPMPYPKMVDLVIMVKPGGFDRVAPRGPRTVGVCDHITEGDASIEWYAQFFGPNGERARDALVDTVIGRDGRIGLLNDWRDPERGGTRAGWANGAANGLEGIGVAFYRRFPAINDVLVSKEHVARTGQPLTDAQIESSAQLSAAVAHNAGCRWNEFPLDERYSVDVEQYHAGFALKPCPTTKFLNEYRPTIVAQARQIMRAWQTGSDHGDPLPPIVPEPIVTYTDYGLSLETVANLFGVIQRYNPDGSVEDLPFNPQGPLSMLWLKRAEERGEFPEAESIQLLDSTLLQGKEWFATWEGGWVAIQPAGDTRASWQWLDEVERKAA